MRQGLVRRSANIVALLASLAGCAHGPDPPRGSLTLTLDEARTCAAVRTALLNDDTLGLRRIGVQCQAGAVTLAGEVRSVHELQQALSVTRAVDGVAEVRSELRVVP